MGQRYFENFKTIADVHEQFSITSEQVQDAQILYAYYGSGSYCGAATVLFQRDGTLYEVTASHCSCDGLEGEWTPAEVTWEQLAMRPDHHAYFEDDEGGRAQAALNELIRQHAPRG